MMLLAVGFVVGMALGLTGAGGSIVAVPLLMFALDLRPQDAMGISLGAVSAAAMVGVLLRRRLQQPPIWNAALGLAITGMCAAPLGRWLANQIDERLIVVLFSLLAAFLAIEMWRSAAAGKAQSSEPGHAEYPQGLAQRAVFLGAGAGLGLLAGLFGVGGGFLIVPFLSLYAGMQMDKAISTSLLVIALVGSSGYLYHVMTSPAQDVQALSVIGVGSILGILAGTTWCTRLSGPGLQRIFSGFVMVIMTYMLVKTLA
jgi:uncharacterized membrane protein YfcA